MEAHLNSIASTSVDLRRAPPGRAAGLRLPSPLLVHWPQPQLTHLPQHPSRMRRRSVGPCAWPPWSPWRNMSTHAAARPAHLPLLAQHSIASTRLARNHGKSSRRRPSILHLALKAAGVCGGPRSVLVRLADGHGGRDWLAVASALRLASTDRPTSLVGVYAQEQLLARLARRRAVAPSSSLAAHADKLPIASHQTDTRVAVTCCAPLHLEGPVAACVSSPALIRRAPATCHRVVH